MLNQYKYRLKEKLSYYLAKARGKLRTFSFQGKKYRYFNHPYNTTWKNERAVEIPIIKAIVEQAVAQQQSILEIGNVLMHYMPVQHQVVDKYEVASGVQNIDIVEFQPRKKFDLIVSISTLEHVGWDEMPKSKTKIKTALNQVRSLLKKNGIAYITLPLGYNAFLDDMLEKHHLKFDDIWYLKRVSQDNQWVETDDSIIGTTKYGEPFQNACGIIIGILKK